MTLLDVRQPSEVVGDPRTLPGAVVIAPDDLEKRYEELSREREVIAYCGCPNDESSVWAAQLLRERGYEAFALAGGYDVWRDAGLPLNGPK